MAKTDLKDHLGKEFKAQGVEGGWVGQEISVKSDTQLSDDHGVGKPIILRHFEFAANPEVFKQHKPTKQELFDSHRQFIETFLWKDGLTPIDFIPPTIKISKKKDKYRILVTCQARAGQIIAEKPQTLTEIANGNRTQRHPD